MCIWLERWREANVYTVTRSPARPHRRRRQHFKGRSRLRGTTAGVAPAGWTRGRSLFTGKARCGGGCLSRGDGASTAVLRRNVRLQLQLGLVGGRRCVGDRHSPDGSLRNNHGTCLSNENSDNADDPSKVVMPPMTIVMHGASLFASDSLGPSAPLIGYVMSTANAVLQHL